MYACVCLLLLLLVCFDVCVSVGREEEEESISRVSGSRSTRQHTRTTWSTLGTAAEAQGTTEATAAAVSERKRDGDEGKGVKGPQICANLTDEGRDENMNHTQYN